MKHVFTIFLISLLATFFLNSCSSNKRNTLEGRDLEFTSYVALGDEYTAGYMNKGLYQQGQENSFPNIIAKQFNEVGDVSFVQPVINGNGTGYIAIDSVIVPTCDQVSSKVVLQHKTPEINWQRTISYENFHRNMGLPRLRIRSIQNKRESYLNPFFGLLNDEPNAEPMSYIDALKGTPIEFFTLWLGMNDVLLFAASGGDESRYPLTEPDTFAQHFDLILSTIFTENIQVKGVIGNVFDITELPFFSTVSHEYLGEKPCDATSRPIFITTQQGIRAATEEDKILLSADSLIGKNNWGLNFQTPIPDDFVLDSEEVKDVQRHIIAYNERIKIQIERHNEIIGRDRFILLNIWSEFKIIHKEGKTINGLSLSGDYLSGGLYSLDGLFPTPRGNAFIGNLFINSLNANFNYLIPNIDIAEYKGVEFP